MRLHRLEVTAFGPFADHQVVDFDRLSTAGLFLLHGPTGAGKTSVLDAVCFALYGRVPGPRAGTGRLRSDHAAPDVAPSVMCEFTIGGRRFEVTRTPEWQRPKRRGSGTVKQHTTVLLRELVDGAWNPLAGGVQEASDVLGDLLGLDVDQFTKLILLPQGDFAAFLRAGAEERRPMLQKLFGTDRFADIERWLAEKRRELDHSMQATRLRTSVLVARALEARLPGTADAEEGVESSPEASTEWVRRWAEAATAERGRAHAAVTAAEDEYEAARRATAEAEAALAERERRTRLTHLLQRLEADGPAQRSRRTRAEAAAAATVLAPLLEDLTEARSTHAATLTTLAARALVNTPAQDVVRARLDRARGEISALATLLESEVALGRLEREYRAAEESIEAAGRRGEAAVTALAELTTRRAELTDQRAAAELVAVTLPDAEREAERADALAAAVTRLRALEQRLAAAHDRRRAAVDAHQGAVTTTQTLRARRLDGMAAELASSLIDESPCSVCGSTDHPAPAEPGAATVTPQEQKAAEIAETAAATARERAEAAAAELEQQRAAALAVTEGATAEQATTARTTASERRTRAREARERVADLTIRVSALTDRIEKAERARTAAEQLTSTARETLAELGGRREELRTRLAAARGDDPDLRTRHARLTAEANADAAHLTAAEAVAEAAERLSRSTKNAENAATAAGFADLSAATEAALPERERGRLLKIMKEYDDELARVRGLLAELDHETAEAERAETERARAEEEAAADGQLFFDFSPAPEPPNRAGADDVDELRERQSAARDRHETARDRHTLAARAVRALSGLADELARHAETTAPLRERFSVVDSVSKCAEGNGSDNLLKMRLSSYVLAARLEQVAEAASDRLAAMSGGRYQLVHTDGLSKGGGRSGLGLAVIDGWTGVQRDPATLSGGETFCTSLALALGLADVVQAEAGGTSIETLLVDEGFGTLDEQTLDEVMDVLDGLRSAGRAVGLVSHVPDLRDRIPARLEVVKTRTGSKLIA